MAYQIAFDLYESATQQFLGRVLEAIRATAPIPHLLEDKVKPKTTETPASDTPAESSATESKVDTPKDERSLENLVSSLGFKTCFIELIRFVLLFSE